MSLISRSYMNTDLLPEKQRIPCWRDRAISVWEISAVTTGNFHGRLDAFHGQEMIFGQVEASAQNTLRTAGRIASDGLDYYLLQFYVQGGRSVSARGNDITIREGDLLVVDMTQPISTISGEFRSIDLALPRRLFAPMLVDPDVHGARRLQGHQPLVSLLKSHLQALYQAGPQMTKAEAVAVQGPTLALAASALNGDCLPKQGQSLRYAMRMAIQRHIEDNLGDMRLSATSIASAFGISRATLYRLMASKGGFQAYLRERRLHRCRDDIFNPVHNCLSISDIAARWGFDNASSFSVAFSRLFGISARECRQIAQGRKVEFAVSGAQDWSSWLMQMK